MGTNSARWYDEPKGDVHGVLGTVFRTIRDECAWRIDADEYHAGLYCASDQTGVRGISRRDYTYAPATLPYNVVRSATDTLLSKVAKHRPLPQVLTQRGSWKNQKRARKMTQFIEGEFYRQRVFEKHWPTFIRDSLIFGRGVLKIWTEGDKIRTERTLPGSSSLTSGTRATGSRGTSTTAGPWTRACCCSSTRRPNRVGGRAASVMPSRPRACSRSATTGRATRARRSTAWTSLRPGIFRARRGGRRSARGHRAGRDAHR